MTHTLTPPRTRTRRTDGSGLGGAWRVIVLNDDHNTFEGVAFALAQTIPGVDYGRGMALADDLHACAVYRARGRRLGRELDIDQVLLIEHVDGIWTHITAIPSDPPAFEAFWA